MSKAAAPWRRLLHPPHRKASPTIDSLLRSCSSISHILQIHAFMIHRTLDQNNFILARFIDCCSALGFPDYGYSLFTRKSRPNIHLWNVAMKALDLSPARSPEVVLLFNKIRPADLTPDTYSFPFALKAVVRLSDFQLGRGIHRQAIGAGLALDANVATALLDMYSKSGHISDARKLFDEIPVRHVALWNAMVAGFAKSGDMDSAQKLFEEMPERNVISWTALITGYARMNRSKEAVAMLCRMLEFEVRLKPNDVTMLAALTACADLGALEAGRWIHRYIDERGLSKTIPLSNALINMYAKSGDIRMALNLFDAMDVRSVVTWTAMIDGLAHHGLGREALEMLSQMERAHVRPNEVTFTAILSACNNAGLVKIGLGFFNRLSSRYGIKSRVEHYGCVVDLLGRSGYLQMALGFVRGMPFEASASIWGALLSAARTYGSPEVAQYAFQHLAKVEPNNGGNYMVLSGIYFDFGMLDEASTVREAVSDAMATTAVGGSSIEVNSIIHEFITGITSHPQYEKICAVIGQMNCHCVFSGVPVMWV